MMKLSVVFLVVFLLCRMELFADEQSSFAPHFSGYTSYENGQLVKGYLNIINSGSAAEVLHPLWMESVKTGFVAEAKVSKNLRIIAAIEGKLGFGLTTGYSTFNGDIPSQLQHWDFTIQQAQGVYTFGDTQKLSMNIGIGYFPYKYNDDAQNLGEYLFRSFAYPASVFTTFDRPYADLMGLRVGNTIALHQGAIHQDLLLTSETKYFPLKDFSLSYVADYTLPDVFCVGLGGSLYRVLPVYLYTGSPNHLTSPGGPNMYIDNSGDTGYYSFSGIKLMARASFDLKCLLPESRKIFGSEEGKMYSEAAILGLKNYPGYYSDIKKRIPIMLGINIPTLKAVDVLALELEYQNTEYINGISKTFYLPYCPIPEDFVSGQPRSKLKWTLQARKTFGTHMVLIGQVANDHLMPENYLSTEHNQPLTDVTYRGKDWWWMLKVRFNY